MDIFWGVQSIFSTRKGNRTLYMLSWCKQSSNTLTVGKGLCKGAVKQQGQLAFTMTTMKDTTRN